MKSFKKITVALLTIVLLRSSFAMPVYAAEGSKVETLDATVTVHEAPVHENESSRSTTFIDTSIDVYFESGNMYRTICTGTSITASVLGVKDIEIQKKGILGTWRTVATSSGGEAYNVISMSASLVYGGAVEGETYRVCCTHYGNVDEYRELYHETSGMICVY